MYRGEEDLLALRMDQLAGKVHQHVLVESPVTHTGLPKQLYYADFRGWPDRIRYVVRALPDAGPWERERHQRDGAWVGLEGIEDSDVILISDLDEIPSDTALAAAATLTPTMPVLGLVQRVFAFAVDWELGPEPTSAMVLASHAYGKSLADLREKRGNSPHIQQGGWHFSWLGGPAEIGNKALMTCHTDMAANIITLNGDHQLYELGKGVWSSQLRAVEVDETYPPYIQSGRCPHRWLRPRR